MSKYLQFKEELLQSIGTLQVGRPIPSRTALCRKYQLSRATVDKALKELVQEGYLYSVKGSGTFVAPREGEGGTRHKGGGSSWGVIVPNIMYDICPSMLRGIEDYAQQYEINIVICNTDNDIYKERDYLYRMTRTGMSGCIIIPAISRQRDLSGFADLQRKGVPFVFCNRGLDALPEVPLVASNDFYGGYIATRYLLAKGYRRIGFISRYHYRTSMSRFYGYMAAIQEAGVPVNRKIISTMTDIAEVPLTRLLREMLAGDDPPDALFCHNDDIAVNLSQALKALGKRISGDVGVIGYDNTSVCESVETKLTSVAYKSYEIGCMAAEVLHKMIHKQPPQGANIFMFQPELVERASALGPRPKEAGPTFG